MFINTISHSKSEVFNQCGLKYKYKYIERLSGDKPRNEDALNFGSYIHKILEDGVEAKDLKQLQVLAEQHKDSYKIPYTYRDKVGRCLTNFLSFNQKLGETVATELVYEVNLDKTRDIKQNGVIDRVIKGREGGFLIIDYKTSKREKNKYTLFKDRQLQAYCYAISEMYKVPIDKITCAHYYPLTNNFVDVKYSRAAIASWKRTELDKVWKIRKKKLNEFKASENTFCNWCEYIDMCPLFEPPIHVEKRLTEQRELAKSRKKQKRV